jgi:excisionase family DNA binding protein
MTTLPAAHDARLTYRVDEASKVSGLSRSTIFEHIRTGRVGSVKVGGRRLIPATALRRLLKLEPTDG